MQPDRSGGNFAGDRRVNNGDKRALVHSFTLEDKIFWLSRVQQIGAFATTLFFLPYHFLLGGSALNVPRLTPKWPLCVRLVCSFQAKEGRTRWARLALER